jgi:hypothetical protein
MRGSTDRLVQRPFLASLSPLNDEFWNHESSRKRVREGRHGDEGAQVDKAAQESGQLVTRQGNSDWCSGGIRTGCMCAIWVHSPGPCHNSFIDSMLAQAVFSGSLAEGGACQMRAKFKLVALVLALRARSIMSSRTRR